MPDINDLIYIRSGEAIRIEDVKSGNMNMVEIGVAHRPLAMYNGPYSFTPTEEQQTVAISGRLAEQDIIIQPIPHNYGRIEWDGSSLNII